MNAGKPRIRIRYGIWCCVTHIPFFCGCGYSPSHAYEDWKRQVRERSEETAGVEHHPV